KMPGTSLLSSLPETKHLPEGQIINLVSVGKVQDQKSQPLLLFKILHKGYLMLMDILKRKYICIALLCIKTYRYSLNSPDIVHRTFIFKIGQGNMPAFLINLYRGDRSGNLLDKRQFFFPV